MLWLWAGKAGSLNFVVVDSFFNILRQNEYPVNYEEIVFRSKPFLDNQGNYFVANILQGKKTSHCELLASYADKSYVNKQIEVSKDVPLSVYITQSPTEGKLKIYGALSKDGYLITGAYSSLMDKHTMGITDFKSKELPEAIVQLAKKEGFGVNSNKAYGILANFVSGYELSDGTVMLSSKFYISGYRKEYTVNSKDIFSAEKRVGSFLLFIFDKDGEIQITRLARNSLVEFYAGSYYHTDGNKLYLSYLDNPSSVRQPNDEKRDDNRPIPKGLNLVIATIERDGSINKKIIIPELGDYDRLEDESSSSVDSKNMVLIMYSPEGMSAKKIFFDKYWVSILD
jgi:hypothetical protein